MARNEAKSYLVQDELRLTLACRLCTSPLAVILTCAKTGSLQGVTNVTSECDGVSILVGRRIFLSIVWDTRITTGSLC